MMEQRVNFFTDLNRPVRDWLNLSFIASLLLAVLLFYSAIIAAQILQQRSLQNQLAEVRNKFSDVRNNYNKLASVQQKHVDKNVYIRRIDALTEDLSIKNSIVQALRQIQQDHTQGFVEPLKALASHPEKGLWLQRIKIRGSDLLMAGFVHQPKSLPVYLEKLKTERYFSGKTFKALEIKKGSDQPERAYRFLMRTSLDKEFEEVEP